jgi:glycosyltransferase involved in cell wall biosynthesis
MRIAYVSPLPPEPSGVADYSAELLPWLAREVAVDAYTSSSAALANVGRWPDIAVRAYEDFPRFRHTYDATVVHLSCERSAVGPYEVFRRSGGSVVLHDLNLSGLFGALVFDRRPGWQFLFELWKQDSLGAFLIAAYRFLRSRRMPGPHDFWMSRGVIRRSRSIVVHNRWSLERVSQILGRRRTPVFHVNMGVPVPPLPTPGDVADARAALGLRADALVLGSFGVVDESKRFSAILRAFRRVAPRLPRAIYLFVGQCKEAHREQVAGLGLSDRVRLVGRVSLQDFYRYMIATDVAFNLRHPAHGEASAPLLRLMSLAKAVAVSRIAQFDELESGICGKISLEREEDDLVSWMMAMSDDQRRIGLGQRARAYVEAHHSLESAARAYRNALQESVVGQRGPGARRLERPPGATGAGSQGLTWTAPRTRRRGG